MAASASSRLGVTKSALAEIKCIALTHTPGSGGGIFSGVSRRKDALTARPVPSTSAASGSSVLATIIGSLLAKGVVRLREAAGEYVAVGVASDVVIDIEANFGSTAKEVTSEEARVVYDFLRSVFGAGAQLSFYSGSPENVAAFACFDVVTYTKGDVEVTKSILQKLPSLLGLNLSKALDMLGQFDKGSRCDFGAAYRATRLLVRWSNKSSEDFAEQGVFDLGLIERVKASKHDAEVIKAICRENRELTRAASASPGGRAGQASPGGFAAARQWCIRAASADVGRRVSSAGSADTELEHSSGKPSRAGSTPTSPGQTVGSPATPLRDAVAASAVAATTPSRQRRQKMPSPPAGVDVPPMVLAGSTRNSQGSSPADSAGEAGSGSLAKAGGGSHQKVGNASVSVKQGVRSRVLPAGSPGTGFARGALRDPASAPLKPEERAVRVLFPSGDAQAAAGPVEADTTVTGSSAQVVAIGSEGAGSKPAVSTAEASHHSPAAVSAGRAGSAQVVPQQAIMFLPEVPVAVADSPAAPGSDECCCCAVM